MTCKIVSLAAFDADLSEEDDAEVLPAADGSGIAARSAARAQQAAMRRASLEQASALAPVVARPALFMEFELPVVPFPKSTWFIVARGDKGHEQLEFRVCLSVLPGAIQLLPNCSPVFKRAPLANSTAETCLRPSSLTDRRSKVVASPQATSNSSRRKSRVPGSALGALSLDTGSPQRWQVCPRKVVNAPGQGEKPRMRLN